MVYVRFFGYFALSFFAVLAPVRLGFTAVSHTSSGWGSASPDQFRALAPANSKIQQAYIEIYRDRAQDPQTFRQARFERSQDYLAQRVAEDFKLALGGKDDWAIIAAEGVNTSPLLGGKGKTKSHLFSARAFAELLGSMPGTKEEPLLARIAKKKEQFETEMSALERKKEKEDLDKKELTALEYAKLGYWAAEEAEKILKEQGEYTEPSGKGDMVAFKGDFAKEFKDKIERVNDFESLVDKAEAGDKKARQTLIDSFAALPTYFTTQSPERANKAVRAVGEGPDNLINLFDQTGKKFPIKFGKTDEEIQNTIAEWADRYRNGDFELKPPATSQIASEKALPQPQVAAQNQLASLQSQQAAQALQRTLSPQQQSPGAQPLSADAIARAQAQITAAQQQFLASRNARDQQAAFQQAQLAIRNALQNQQVQALQRQANQRAVLVAQGYPYTPVSARGKRSSNANFSARDSSLDSTAENIANDGRCTQCHGAKSPEQIFASVHNDGAMPGGPNLAEVLDESEFDELKKWAQAQ